MSGSYVDLDRFRSFVEERVGLCLSEHPDHLARVVRERMVATGSRDFAAYDALLTASAESSKELRAIVEILTVGETYFFRNGDHFRALVEHAIPGRLREAGRRPLSVLSAGCASGEEPYTIAILVREHFPELGPSDITITGVDVNPAAIAKARRARYSPWSLRETTQAVQSRYFRTEGADAALAEEIRRMVEFEERNLFDVDVRFWASMAFDIVFCRNVIIYFSQEKLGEAIARLGHVLGPGGYLFLGHSESLRGMTDDFDLHNTNNTFYYQRRDPYAPRPDGGSVSSWTTSIDRASWRVRQLTSRPAPPPTVVADGAPTPGLALAPSLRPDPPPSLGATVDLATELYQQERFAEALGRLDAVPTDLQEDVTVQLLRAAILTNQGELKAAETVCRRVLAVDDRNAGAHYLTALVRDREGDREAAVRHDEMAAYLDTTFAMPRLHLGMLARQAGDLTAARRELSRALALLGREDASRVLLFGGGFGRDALVGLCKAELRAAGGKS
jgi:chemotaxis protein methyltransferase CheR